MNLPDLEPMLHAVYGRLPSDVRIEALAGEASSRRYFRVFAPAAEPERLVLMLLPGGAAASEELSSAGASGQSETAELPFLTMQRFLKERGLRVPNILADRTHTDGLLALEDLGDCSFETSLSEGNRHERYASAVDKIVEFQQATQQPPQSPHLAYSRRFDFSLLYGEFEHFREWGLEALGGPLDPVVKDELDDTFRRWAERLESEESCLVHRDFQSRNLMWKHDELVLIDFQDALLGPRAYDLAALLCDSYVDNSEALQQDMLDRYREKTGLPRQPFETSFWLIAAQRKLKDAGRFIYIDRVRNNPSFLKWFPQSLVYVDRALVKLSADPWAERAAKRVRKLLISEIPGFPDTVEVPASIHGQQKTVAIP